MVICLASVNDKGVNLFRKECMISSTTLLAAAQFCILLVCPASLVSCRALSEIVAEGYENVPPPALRSLVFLTL